MRPLPHLPLLTVVCLVLTAGCFGAVGGSDAPRTPVGTPVQGTTPTGDWDPTDSVPVQRFTSGAAVCGRSNVPTRMAISGNATADVVTVTLDGNVSVEDVARFAPPAALVEDAPGRYTLWVSTREDTRRTPRACDGHVPYEAVFDLPHGGLAGFHLTVMHDGERVATWGNESV